MIIKNKEEMKKGYGRSYGYDLPKSKKQMKNKTEKLKQEIEEIELETSQGYIIIKKPKHPLSNCNGYIKRCRLVMEKHLGRYLKPKEVVHHINEIKDDDKIENLKLFENETKHQKYHLKGNQRARKNSPEKSKELRKWYLKKYLKKWRKENREYIRDYNRRQREKNKRKQKLEKI